MCGYRRNYKPAKPVNVGTLIFGLALLFVGLTKLTVMVASVAADEPVAVAPEVYLLEGYNVRSYVEENGQVCWDGVAWDWITLVNPRIEGERIYIPAEENHGKENHFFYIDSTSRFTGPIYRIKEGAVCYIEDEHQMDIKEDSTFEPCESNGLLVGPEICPNGMNRVYVNWLDQPGDGTKRFFYRSELELIRPSEQKAS